MNLATSDVKAYVRKKAPPRGPPHLVSSMYLDAGTVPSSCTEDTSYLTADAARAVFRASSALTRSSSLASDADRSRSRRRDPSSSYVEAGGVGRETKGIVYDVSE